MRVVFDTNVIVAGIVAQGVGLAELKDVGQALLVPGTEPVRRQRGEQILNPHGLAGKVQ